MAGFISNVTFAPRRDPQQPAQVPSATVPTLRVERDVYVTSLEYDWTSAEARVEELEKALAAIRTLADRAARG